LTAGSKAVRWGYPWVACWGVLMAVSMAEWLVLKTVAWTAALRVVY
jgi:hypothetical protein